MEEYKYKGTVFGHYFHFKYSREFDPVQNITSFKRYEGKGHRQTLSQDWIAKFICYTTAYKVA